MEFSLLKLVVWKNLYELIIGSPEDTENLEYLQLFPVTHHTLQGLAAGIVKYDGEFFVVDTIRLPETNIFPNIQSFRRSSISTTGIQVLEALILEEIPFVKKLTPTEVDLTLKGGDLDFL